MSRLTQSDRDRLQAQIVGALLPDLRAAHRKLEDAAFRAVLADFYTPAGLKRIATLPAHWLTEVKAVNVLATGRKHHSRAYGLAPAHLPRGVPDDHKLGEAAQKAVDAWADATAAAARERDGLNYEVGRLLGSVTTLEALLAKLPAARGILRLPPAQEPGSIAAKINTRLAERAKPRPSKEQK